MGIASVIPFISISSLSISFGLYDLVIDTITNLFKNLKLNIITLAHILIGIVLGLISGIKLIEFAFKHAKTQAILLFIGIIAGGIYLMFKDNKVAIKNKKYLIVSFLIFIISVCGYYFTRNISITLLVPDGLNLLIILLVGIALGISLFIPGFGLVVINIFKNYYNILFDFKSNLVLGIIIVIGIFIGIYIACRALMNVRKKYALFNNIILGLMISSIVIAFINMNIIKLDFINIFTSLFTLFWGFMLAKNLIKE